MTIQQEKNLGDQAHLRVEVEPRVSPVKFNAVKHGILSTSPVIPIFESTQDWENFRNAIFEEVKPSGGLTMALTDRAAGHLWRLQRVTRCEREAIFAQIMNTRRDIDLADGHTGDPRDLTPELAARMQQVALTRLLPDDPTLQKIIRYEARLHRQLHQTIHQIRLLQGEPNRTADQRT